MQKQQSFYKHKAELGIKVPVTRSSALFYFNVQSPVQTCLYFLNYWALKRNIFDVTLRLTLRNMAGEELLMMHHDCLHVGANELHINRILRDADLENSCSEGSVEIEFFSEQNLFVPFPAVTIRYFSEDWHTVAHSSQRILAEISGDQNIDALKQAVEGNQTIHANEDYAPFFVIHNGPQQYLDEDFILEVKSDSGRVREVSIPDTKWAPFQTRIFELDSLMDLREFLNGEGGSYRIKYTVSGVFPRLIAGFKDVKTGAWSVDHTNFATEATDASNDVFPVEKQPKFKNLVFNVPTPKFANCQSFVDVYPTYPQDDYRIAVNNNEGQKIDGQELHLPPVTSGKTTRIETTGQGNTELEFLADSRLPRRFHLGVHYQCGNNLPGFLIDGPLPHSSGGQRTRWFPVFSGEDTINVISASYRYLGEKIQGRSIPYQCVLYNAINEKTLEFTLEIEPDEENTVVLEDHVANARSFLGNRSGWIYMTCDSPQFSVVHYLSVKDNKSIAVDHAF